MSESPRLALSRPVVALLAIAGLALIVVADTAATGLPDPMAAPPPVALGSGLAPGGAHGAAQ